MLRKLFVDWGTFFSSVILRILINQFYSNTFFSPYCRYFPLLDLAFCSAMEVGVKSFLTHLIKSPPRPADFVAYFRQDIPNILCLICCHCHLKGKVIGDLEAKNIKPSDGSSNKKMIPGHDKAFVCVSEAIYPFNEEDMKDLFLM